jgi:hypothetical protein
MIVYSPVSTTCDVEKKREQRGMKQKTNFAQVLLAVSKQDPPLHNTQGLAIKNRRLWGFAGESAPLAIFE